MNYFHWQARTLARSLATFWDTTNAWISILYRIFCSGLNFGTNSHIHKKCVVPRSSLQCMLGYQSNSSLQNSSPSSQQLNTHCRYSKSAMQHYLVHWPGLVPGNVVVIIMISRAWHCDQHTVLYSRSSCDWDVHDNCQIVTRLYLNVISRWEMELTFSPNFKPWADNGNTPIKVYYFIVILAWLFKTWILC